MDHLRDLRKHGLFDQKVPRFTSYPPANRFVPGAGAENFSNWLEATPDGADLSLYVHVPFCRNLCFFCACRTQGTKSDGPLARYVAGVLAEAKAVRARLPKNLRIARLHFGGGTPTILPKSIPVRLGM